VSDLTVHIIYLRPVGWADWQIPIGAIDSDDTGYVAATLPDAEDLSTPEQDGRKTVIAMHMAIDDLTLGSASLSKFAGHGGCIAVSRPYSCRDGVRPLLDRVLPGGIRGDDDGPQRYRPAVTARRAC